MATPPWLDEVLKRLRKHSLPPTYVQRFADELSDHFQDLKEENMKTETDVYSRLGAPEQVADAAAVAYRRRSFIGRHPLAAFFAFAVSPVVSLILLFGVMAFGMYVLGTAAEYCGIVGNGFIRRNPPGPFAMVMLHCVFSLCTIIIPALVASIFYCKLSKRLGMGRKWMCVACAVLALTAMLPFCFISPATIPSATGHYAVQFGLVLNIPLKISGIWCWLSSGERLIQALVPLAIGGWFFWRYVNKPNRVSITAT